MIISVRGRSLNPCPSGVKNSRKTWPDPRSSAAHQAFGLRGRLTRDFRLLVEIPSEDGCEASADRVLGYIGGEQIRLDEPPEKALGYPLDLRGRGPHSAHLDTRFRFCKKARRNARACLTPPRAAGIPVRS